MKNIQSEHTLYSKNIQWERHIQYMQYSDWTVLYEYLKVLWPWGWGWFLIVILKWGICIARVVKVDDFWPQALRLWHWLTPWYRHHVLMFPHRYMLYEDKYFYSLPSVWKHFAVDYTLCVFHFLRVWLFMSDH